MFLKEHFGSYFRLQKGPFNKDRCLYACQLSGLRAHASSIRVDAVLSVCDLLIVIVVRVLFQWTEALLD